METIRGLLWKPTPEEQKRKCNALVRSNVRKLEREIQGFKTAETKAKALIVEHSKRAQRASPNSGAAIRERDATREFARSLITIRKQNSRLLTGKAQLQSVQMQVNEAFSVRKIEGSLRASTGIMKDVNSLVRLPELTGTMRELSQELVRAGIIEEMVGDSLPDSELLEGEDDAAEAEVDKILGEILKDRLPASAEKPVDSVPTVPVTEENNEEELKEMKGRLQALRG
ncbi:hypothetical protein BU16DRAFT_617440 [Lophium mytilinum]|uniref:Snf7-domain-containing protein n=1 Tax=Lophium mytilinum TaxID=390894 RepID=A0A6A6QU28_9PEZI|nr:hypothetical protein BU16DRAFT_617440 [Lophium mytilinum]